MPRDSSSPLPEPPQLSTAERLNLCEACGLLLGAGLSPAELVGEQTQRLLEMPITQLQALSSQAAAGTPASLSLDSTSARQLTQARYAEAAFHVSSIAVASKGFANLTEEPQKASLRESFSHATQVCAPACASECLRPARAEAHARQGRVHLTAAPHRPTWSPHLTAAPHRRTWSPHLASPPRRLAPCVYAHARCPCPRPGVHGRARCAQVALSSMSVFGQSPEVRGKCLMLLHRMVETLGEELLDYLDAAMQPLLAMADAKELGEVCMHAGLT